MTHYTHYAACTRPPNKIQVQKWSSHRSVVDEYTIAEYSLRKSCLSSSKERCWKSPDIHWVHIDKCHLFIYVSLQYVKLIDYSFQCVDASSKHHKNPASLILSRHILVKLQIRSLHVALLKCFRRFLSNSPIGMGAISSPVLLKSNLSTFIYIRIITDSANF